MILGVGTDITQISRFLDNPDRLADKILTDYERREYNESRDKACYLAKKWAAKEAVSKAWGTGIAKDAKWKSIEIRHTVIGQPIVIVHGQLKENWDTLGAKCFISISDESEYVTACAVVERS